MTLLELKQELITYANSLVPETYQGWVHILSSQKHRYIFVRSIENEVTLPILSKYHDGKQSASMQLNNRKNGCIPLMSYQADVSKHHLLLNQVFPGVNEIELIAQEKSSVRNNLRIAFFIATEKGIFKYLKGLQQEGLIEKLESELMINNIE